MRLPRWLRQPEPMVDAPPPPRPAPPPAEPTRVARSPDTEGLVVFRALRDFNATVNGIRQHYTEGLTYNIHPSNHHLHDLALGPGGWKEGGYIEVIHPRGPQARVNASGRVT